MNAIPASEFVSSAPSVLAAAGNPLSFNAVFVTHDNSIPIGTTQGFPDLDEVGAWFGLNSIEYELAEVYFGGFRGCTVLPGMLYFVQYNVAAAAAYLRGGSVAAMSLAQLQALSGTLIISINGETVSTPSINLAGATSFTNAAALINTGLDTTGDIFSGTASTSGSSATLTIATTVSGAPHIGDVIAGTGITGGTTIASIGTYNGVTGTVILSAAMTVSASTVVTISSTATCSYDVLRKAFVIASPTTGATSLIGFATGTLSAGLLLTSATGAVLSQGAAAATPAGIMQSVKNATQNWVSFTTMFEPDEATKEAFALWNAGQNQRYLYAAWDSNVLAIGTPPQSSTFAQITKAENGIASIYDASGEIAAWLCGAIASTDFSALNGYTVYAGKGSSLLTPNVTDDTQYKNLVANGYSCYAAIATADETFQWFENGQISGDWDWIDEYVFQIWLNNALQLSGMLLIDQTKFIPFNSAGSALIYSAYKGPILDGKDFGGIQSGIELSPAQIAEVNLAAGIPIDDILFTQGWYLKISIPDSTVQQTRGPWPATLWYCNAGGVQTLRIASINIQ